MTAIKHFLQQTCVNKRNSKNATDTRAWTHTPNAQTCPLKTGISHSPESPECVFLAQNLTKVYGEGATAVHALRGVNLRIRQGEFVVLLYPGTITDVQRGELKTAKGQR
jgi:ABC-type glutathione transport system ATPase component